MRAIYNASENVIYLHPDTMSSFEEWLTNEDSDLEERMESENKHMEDMANTRKISCSPECKEVFKDGQILRKGIDYTVAITRKENGVLIRDGFGGPDAFYLAYPIKQSQSTDLETAALEYATKMSSAPDKDIPDWIISDFKAGANWQKGQSPSIDNQDELWDEVLGITDTSWNKKAFRELKEKFTITRKQ
jgi:hypothetical protein